MTSADIRLCKLESVKGDVVLHLSPGVDFTSVKLAFGPGRDDLRRDEYVALLDEPADGVSVSWAVSVSYGRPFRYVPRSTSAGWLRFPTLEFASPVRRAVVRITGRTNPRSDARMIFDRAWVRYPALEIDVYTKRV